ncbi:MAG TPA: HNH endonuclease [Armatimonadota bacterium]|jgi:hypothetical protein
MPMKRHLYPPEWRAIALAVKQAADWTCRECGRVCRRAGEPYVDWILRVDNWEALEHPRRFVLTVAHLDHDPSNNVSSNLRALCSVCHLRHDAGHHALSASHTRAVKRAAGTLPLEQASHAGGGHVPGQMAQVTTAEAAR